MNTVSYKINGGDFQNDGAGSRAVKEQLKRVGADPAVIRRAMVAAYEAEMNVVIHAHRGELRAELLGGRLRVVVEDEGPGIPDIALAMTPGFSTASAEARQLGFGAGMGLPNIKKNTDECSIESTVGRGTRVSFTISLKPQALYGIGTHSLRVIPENCRQCLACVRVCPTSALRVFRDKPEVLDYLCVDCADCIAICPTNAFTIEGMDAGIRGAKEETVARELSPAGGVLVLPTPCLVQYGAGADAKRILRELANLGFDEVRVTHPWEQALREAAVEYARQSPHQRTPPGAPVISPVCPAVIDLIEMRFPLLLGNVAPFLSPLEAVHIELKDRSATTVILCPGQRTSLTTGEAATKSDMIVPALLRSAIMPRLHGDGACAPEGPRTSVRAEVHGEQGFVLESPPGLKSGAPLDRGVLQVTGFRHVRAVLEAVEDGLLSDVLLLELYACEGGCFGSPLLAVDPSLAAYRWESSLLEQKMHGEARRRLKLPAPRRGLRLDADMSKAIAKLAKIDKLARSLPGCDCCMCGAPTCAALAEDIILGRAGRGACVKEALAGPSQGSAAAPGQEERK
jgi:anti-sigma regulatory factor (Ser/Thr protein kinase)/Pyruvate/2-oxoacid:ferredoxin oxidoreductase delta subunit